MSYHLKLKPINHFKVFRKDLMIGVNQMTISRIKTLSKMYQDNKRDRNRT